MRRRTRRTVVGVLALGVVVGAAAFVAGPDEAGAVDWYKSSQVEYVDLLVVPYDPSPGRGDSIHATCAAGLTGVEFGVHPFDGVARNFQVWRGGDLLLNVNEAVRVQVFPFGDLRIMYSGGEYLLVDEVSQRALCVAGALPATVAPPVTTAANPEPAPVLVVDVATPVPAPPGVVVLGVGVTATRTLPATGASAGTLALVSAVLLLAGLVVLVAAHAVKEAKR